MLIVNRDKERVKAFLPSQITNDITALNTRSNHLREVMSRIVHMLGGSQRNADVMLLDVCRRAIHQLDEAANALHRAYARIGDLDIYEEVEDD